MKICRYCHKQLSNNKFYPISKDKLKLSSICRTCRAEVKRKVTDKKSQIKYYEDIKNNGYFLKVCNHHGQLNYSDINLKIIDTEKESDRNPKARFRVWMSCGICAREKKLKTYNEGLENTRKLLDFLKCSTCQKEKTIQEFSYYMWRYRYPSCQSCITEKRQKYYLNKNIKNKLAVTEEEYNAMLIKQNNLCKICGQKETHRHHLTKTLFRLAIDHNHNTGKIRDLLCRGCNLMIGNSYDNPETLRKAALYLENHA